VKKRKKKCGRGGSIQVILFLPVDRESPCISEWSPASYTPMGKQGWQQRALPLPVRVCTPAGCWAVLEGPPSLQLPLPESLFGAVCELRQEPPLWLPSRNSEEAEREWEEGTLQLYHIYLTVWTKRQNWTPECLKQEAEL